MIQGGREVEMLRDVGSQVGGLSVQGLGFIVVRASR